MKKFRFGDSTYDVKEGTILEIPTTTDLGSTIKVSTEDYEFIATKINTSSGATYKITEVNDLENSPKIVSEEVISNPISDKTFPYEEIKDLGKKKKSELLEIALGLGLDVPEKIKKVDLIQLIANA